MYCIHAGRCDDAAIYPGRWYGNTWIGLDCCRLIRYDENYAEVGTLLYSLSTDGKEIPQNEKRRVSTWVVSRPDGLHQVSCVHRQLMRSIPRLETRSPQVEFEHDTYDVIVDSVKVEAMGDFTEDGSVYHFMLGAPPAAAEIRVTPIPGKQSKLRTRLLVEGSPIQQCELLGVDEDAVDDDAGRTAPET